MNVENEGLISTNSTLILLKKKKKTTKKSLTYWLFPHFQFGLKAAISIYKIIVSIYKMYKIIQRSGTKGCPQKVELEPFQAIKHIPGFSTKLRTLTQRISHCLTLCPSKIIAKLHQHFVIIHRPFKQLRMF